METKHNRRRENSMQWAAGVLAVVVAAGVMSCAGLILWIPEPESLLDEPMDAAGIAAPVSIQQSLELAWDEEAARRRKQREDFECSMDELREWFKQVERDMFPNRGANTD